MAAYPARAMTDARYGGASHNRPTQPTDDSAADTVTSAAIAMRAKAALPSCDR